MPGITHKLDDKLPPIYVKLLDLDTPTLFKVTANAEDAIRRHRVGLKISMDGTQYIIWFTDDYNYDGFEWDYAKNFSDLEVRRLKSHEALTLNNKE